MLNKPLLPTAYLAPISYYAILLNSSECKIEYHEHFLKQSIRNRCDIYGANGKLRLTVPKQRAGSSKTIITKIKICYKNKWQQEHWKSIVSAYNSSPFFEYYKDELIHLFKNKEVYLINLNNKLLKLTLKLLELNAEYTHTNRYKKEGDFTDLRKENFQSNKIEKYNQVFMERYGFISNLSILDLLFNLGPESADYLRNLNTTIKI